MSSPSHRSARVRPITAAAAFLGVVALLIPAGRAEGQTLQEFTGVPRSRPPQVTIFADGNVRNVVGQSSDATSATGAIGVIYRGPTFLISGSVNVLGRSDTVSNDFGATLLPPAAGRSFNAGVADLRVPRLGGTCPTNRVTVKTFTCRFGLHAYASASSVTWATAKDTAGVITAATDVPVWATGVGLYYTFFDGTVATTNRVAMAIDATFAQRHLRGDLSRDDENATRQAMLGTLRRNFRGLETGLTVRYNEINAGLTYYSMSGDVRGFSHGQVVAGISVRAKLNGGDYTEGDTGSSGGEEKP